MEKGKIVLAFLTIALLLAMIGASTAVPVRTPGVNVGDTFTYGNGSFNWYSNDPSATPPTEWKDLNQTDWFLVSVENVVGTNVTGSFLSHFSNGTETTEGGWVDVDTGDDGNMSLFFISANLDSGDSIYSSGEYSTWMINETIPKTYLGGPRDTNHLNITMEMSEPPFYVYLSWDVYWDRTTGVLVEMSMSSNQTMIYTTAWSFSIELTESNKWVIPEFAGPLQTLLLLTSLTLATLVCRRKMHKTQNR